MMEDSPDGGRMMDIPILIETLADGRFRARTGEPLGVTAEGATRDDALRAAERSIHAKLSNGTMLASVAWPGEPNPWIEGAGCLKDDPLFDEWMAEIRENRKRMDAETDD